MNTQNFVWLAIDYHLPTTYSCRIPMSSQHSALAMPAPGPATVRLAAVRTGIELFGVDYVREELFPVIGAAEILVKPPEKVAISSQLIRGYKARAVDRTNSNGGISESLSYREVCHAEGSITIYVKVPLDYEAAFQKVFQAIGYWGQANSLTYYMGITHAVPRSGDVAVPLRLLQTSRPIQQFFSCIVSDFRDVTVKWSEILPDTFETRRTDTGWLHLELYLWPMIISEQHSGGKLLVYRSLI